nr:hypothetical protein [Tanacetum cinerariifolium]
MKNVNLFIPVPPNKIRAKITQELNELRAISAIIDSRLENIGHVHILIPPLVLFEQLLDDFINPPYVLELDDLESDSESNDTPLDLPFLDSDDESDDREVNNELNENGNVGNFYRNSIDGNDLTFPCMIEDMEEFIVSEMADVVMGRPFRAVSQLEYDCFKGNFSKKQKKYLRALEKASGLILTASPLGWHLEEIHVTWTQFRKKRDKIATLQEEAQILRTDRGDGVRISSDTVRMCN